MRPDGAVTYQPKPDTVLVLRTCAANGDCCDNPARNHHDPFRWPESGHVVCPDWDATPGCGHGLHGLLWGAGDVSLLSWATDARWLVLEVPAATVVCLDGGKVKFPTCEVVL
jgi:hypothetical protein